MDGEPIPGIMDTLSQQPSPVEPMQTREQSLQLINGERQIDPAFVADRVRGIGNFYHLPEEQIKA